MTKFWLISVMTVLASPAFAQNFNQEPPNAPHQTPAFEGQTRAPMLPPRPALEQQVIIAGLDDPWAIDQLPDGRWIVTEKPGRMRVVAQNGTISEPIAGLPAVDKNGQGGLLDVVIADDFDKSRRLWWSYAEPRKAGQNATSVATGVLSPDDTRMQNVQVIFRQQPAWPSTLHYGSRLVFDRSGALFVTTGERSEPASAKLAQDVTTHLGKVLRIDPMGGSAAKGNPDWATPSGAQPEIWSYGHRNIQSAALSPSGELWTVEHGPQGGDELNKPEAGKNYGWPIITYGEHYSGAPVGRDVTAQKGMEQPVYYWDPVIAPSGMAFYEGALFPHWSGDILIGGLAGQALVRLTLQGTRVTGEARYLQDQGRIRDIDIAADGAVIILKDDAMVRLSPKS